jgi:hypothetical protein
MWNNHEIQFPTNQMLSNKIKNKIQLHKRIQKITSKLENKTKFEIK